MSRTPIEFEVTLSKPCVFDAIAVIPAAGASLIATATGTDAGQGNWTGIGVTITNVDTGAVQLVNGRSDSGRVDLPIIVKERGRYRVQAVQSNFRETCETTTVSGRTLPGRFFE
jgi:hypothetical protein